MANLSREDIINRVTYAGRLYEEAAAAKKAGGSADVALSIERKASAICRDLATGMKSGMLEEERNSDAKVTSRHPHKVDCTRRATPQLKASLDYSKFEDLSDNESVPDNISGEIGGCNDNSHVSALQSIQSADEPTFIDALSSPDKEPLHFNRNSLVSFDEVRLQPHTEPTAELVSPPGAYMAVTEVAKLAKTSTADITMLRTYSSSAKFHADREECVSSTDESSSAKKHEDHDCDDNCEETTSDADLGHRSEPSPAANNEMGSLQRGVIACANSTGYSGEHKAVPSTVLDLHDPSIARAVYKHLDYSRFDDIIDSSDDELENSPSETFRIAHRLAGVVDDLKSDQRPAVSAAKPSYVARDTHECKDVPIELAVPTQHSSARLKYSSDYSKFDALVTEICSEDEDNLDELLRGAKGAAMSAAHGDSSSCSALPEGTFFGSEPPWEEPCENNNRTSSTQRTAVGIQRRRGVRASFRTTTAHGDSCSNSTVGVLDTLD